MSSWPELRINVGRLRHIDPSIAPTAHARGADTIEVEHTVSASGLEVSTARIPEGSDVHVEAVLRATLTGIEARLDVTATWEGECRRCLDPVTTPLHIETTATFLDSAAESGATSGDDDADAYPLDGDWVDLGEVVREELMLALPLSPLCGPDCVGADPDRFPTTPGVEPDESGDGDADGSPKPIDPRWEALSGLTFDEDT